MATRENIPVFSTHDMTVDTMYYLRTSTNYSLQLQLAWTGLTGVGQFSVEGSLDNVNWSAYPLKDCNQCRYIWALQGSSDTFLVKIDNWSFSHLRINYFSNTASAGSIVATLSLIDNQDVSTN